MSFGLAFLAMLAELAAGYPGALYRAVGHPVSWTGRLIAALERRWNDPARSERCRRLGGCLALAVVVLGAGAAGLAVQALAKGWAGLVVAAVLAGTLIAQRSLAAHVGSVARALEEDGLAGGRQAVAEIVGRDPESLDEGGVARAAVESLAENFSDGGGGAGALAGGRRACRGRRPTRRSTPRTAWSGTAASGIGRSAGRRRGSTIS